MIVYYFYTKSKVSITINPRLFINCLYNNSLNNNLSKQLNSITEYVTKPINVCEPNEILVLAYVFISVKSFEKRSVIRQTWANKTLFKNLKVVFMLGLSNNQSLNKLVLTENQIHNDLIQSNFY